MTLSIVMAVYNEAEHLSRCLTSVKDLPGEIIVVDGGSDDETAAIARRFGAKVIKTSNKTMFHTNKQMAIEKAGGDWILQLDADEVVDDELKQAIRFTITQNSVKDAFYIKRKNFFLGRFLTKGGQYPDPVIRLFKRGKAFLPQQSVHEQMRVAGITGELPGHLLHYNAPTFRRYLTNANRYTSLTAEDLLKQGKRMRFFNDIYYLFVKPWWVFVKLYVRHRGYKDGFPGLVFALFSGFHHALAYMKLGDLHAHRR